MSLDNLPDRQSVSDLLRACAETILLPRFCSLPASEVYRKGKDSVVTQADFEAERFLEQGLRAILPNAIVLGEEAVKDDEQRMNILLQKRGANPVWLVDPLDGTRNFVKHSPIFCSMVALVEKEKVCASWIYSHCENRILHARGESAVFVDDTPLEIALKASSTTTTPPNPTPAASLEDSTLPRGRISWTKKPLPYDERHIHRLASVRCAGQDFVDLACRHTDFSYYNALWPWDHAAGGFLLQCAGGRVADFATGSIPSPFARSEALLATRRGMCWKALQKTLDGRTEESSYRELTKNKETRKSCA